jgi:hypothetical protein
MDERQIGLDLERRSGGPILDRPAWPKTRATVPWCTCSWRAIVPTIIRTIGIVGAKAKIGLQNLAYNIRRLVTLERMAAA